MDKYKHKGRNHELFHEGCRHYIKRKEIQS